MKKTPLNQLHRDKGAKMTNFGGWEMPVKYTGIIEEHKAVRKKCGLFDISHMGEILVSGANSAESIQRIITNDIEKITEGEMLYTPMCNEDGGIIDDFLIYNLANDQYLMVVNAFNTEKDFNWIKDHLLESATAKNVSDQYAVFALQGPESKKILEKLTDFDLNSLKYYTFKKAKVAEVETIISKNGYTGELGYEIYFEASKAEKIWFELEKAGSELGLSACGLGARDTLRLEKMFLLYGNDIDENINPLEAGMGWTVVLDKDNFIGKNKLVEIKTQGIKRKLSPFKIKGRAIARHGYEIYSDQKKIGEVTSGSYSPTLDASIGLAYLKNKYTKAGTEIEIKIRSRRVKAEVVKGPFV